MLIKYFIISIILTYYAHAYMNHRIVKRFIIKNQKKHWPVTIYYGFNEKNPTVNKNYNETKYIEKVRFAYSWLEARTCLKFVRNDTHRPRLDLYAAGSCATSLGLGKPDQIHQVRLGPGCIWYPLLIHETFHALGYAHEMQRADRDDYIIVHNENIHKSRHKEFRLYPKGWLHDLSMPYDMGSLMHYSNRAFTNNSDPTQNSIETKDPYYQHTIGYHGERYPSLLDLKKINLAYCKDHCKDAAIKCENGGYLNPSTQCKTCVCPMSFTGDTCNELKKSEETCSVKKQIYIASTEWQKLHVTLSSVKTQKCYYMIQSKPGTYVEFKAVDIKLKANGNCGNFIEFRTSVDRVGPRLCSLNNTKGEPFWKGYRATSTTNVAVIIEYLSSHLVKNDYFTIEYRETTVPMQSTLAPTTKVPLSPLTYGQQIYGGHEYCYAIDESKSFKNWPNARLQCQQDGGDLAKISNKQQADAISAFVKAYDGSYFVKKWRKAVWIGLNDIQMTDDWRWVNDNSELANYTDWNRQYRKPTKNMTEHCVRLHAPRTNDRWFNTHCTFDRATALCQRRNACYNVKCLNGGVCHTSADCFSEFQCHCKKGWNGKLCEKNDANEELEIDIAEEEEEHPDDTLQH